MYSRVRLYSKKKGEIYKFLSKFYKDSLENNDDVFNDIYRNTLEWENIYSNPVEIANMLGVFIDNADEFDITMWISLDKGFFINVTKENSDNIIRYLYERYPY